MAEGVITFPGAEPLPENPITLKDRPYSLCTHGSISLDEHVRTVNCAECGAILDAFDFLRDNARTLQRAWNNYRSVAHKAREIEARIEVLDKERKRMSAQLKRQQEKGAAVNVRGKDLL